MNWEKKTKELTDREKEILELIDKKKMRQKLCERYWSRLRKREIKKRNKNKCLSFEL